jgi:beta-fructofuranosidase
MSRPRELSVRDGRLYSEPAAELAALRRTATPVPPTGATRFEQARAAGELVLDAETADGVRRVTLRSPGGAETVVDLTEFAGRGGVLRLFWDAGIVEVYRGGVAGTWSDLRVEEVGQLRLDGAPGSAAAGRAEIWELARPQREFGPAAAAWTGTASP